MTGMVKALLVVGGLGLAGGPAATGVRPLKMLLEIHDGIRDMNLSAEQTTQIRGILKAHRSEGRAAADRLAAARQAVEDATRQEPLDEALVRRRVQEAGAVAVDAALLHARVRTELRQVMNDEQRQKADALHDLVRKDAAELRQHFRALVDSHIDGV